MRTTHTILLLAGAVLTPGLAFGQIEGMLGGDKGTPFTAPSRAFQVTVPPGWGVALVPNDPDTVQFRAQNAPGHGHLYIRRFNVPAGASAKQLLLNGLEQRLKKLPSFRLGQKRAVQLGGAPAASVVGTYDFHGNAQYPRVVEEVFVVVGTDGFVFHFECATPVANQYAPSLNLFYQSFQPRSAPAQGPFAVEGEEEPVDDSVLDF